MNKAQAYRRGIASGYEAGIYGDFTAKELGNEDTFAEAAAERRSRERRKAAVNAGSIVPVYRQRSQHEASRRSGR